MKILFLGDVMGRAGRAAISEHLPRLRKEWSLDFVVVDGENATSGMGLSGAHAQIILDAGADVITLGDHAFDQKDMLTYIEKEPRIIRPMNFSKKAPGIGARVFEATRGRKVLVTQVRVRLMTLSRLWMRPYASIRLAGRSKPASWIFTVKPHPRKWRLVISATDAPALSSAHIRMCQLRMR